MHRIAPFALLAALIATAGSGLAALEAAQEAVAFADLTAQETLAFEGALASDAQAKVAGLTATGAYVVDNPSTLAQVAVANAIFLKNEAEATAINAVGPIAQDPGSAWSFVRSWSDTAYAAAWMKADMAQAVADNLQETAQAVVALEIGALEDAPEAALSCSAAGRPLACAEDFVHSIVDA